MRSVRWALLALLLPVAAQAGPNPDLPTGEIPEDFGFQEGAQVGAQAPEVTLYDSDDAEVLLSSLQGQVVLLNFWASWCGPCKRELPEFNRFQERFGDQGFELVAVNVDRTKGAALRFLREEIGGEFTVLFDHEATSMGPFGVSSMPTSFLIDRDGVVRHHEVGYREENLADWEREIQRWLR